MDRTHHNRHAGQACSKLPVEARLRRMRMNNGKTLAPQNSIRVPKRDQIGQRFHFTRHRHWDMPDVSCFNACNLGTGLFFYREGPAGNLENYHRTERTVRDILHRYGPPLVGGRHTRLLLMRSLLKSMAYRIGTKLGLQGRLIRKRNRPLNAAEIREGRRILCAIRNTPVAGLDRVLPAPSAQRLLQQEGAA